MRPAQFARHRLAFWIIEIELPHILTRGLLHVDLMMHHPMVEYQLQAPDCAVLEVQGFQSGFGSAMNQNTNGLIGLDEKR